MSRLESGAAVLRHAVATPITAAVGRPSGVDAWLGRRVGEFVLDDGSDAARSIQAYLPQDPAQFQYVSDLPGEAVLVARRSAVSSRQSQVALEDARTGAWHVAGLVDQFGAPIQVDELGAIRQTWNDARFDGNHVDAGSVHGEAHDFPLRDDIRRAIDELDLEFANPDMPAVATDSAQVALTAATRSEVSVVAPMRAKALAPLPGHAIEPVAVFEPIEGIPGYLSRPVLFTASGAEFAVDLAQLRASSGSIDDVRKLARRMSMELGNQQVAAFETAPNRYLLGPVLVTPPTRTTRPLRADVASGMLDAIPEAKFVTGAAGGHGSGLPARPSTASPTLDPARSAARMRQLTQMLDAQSTELLTARAVLSQTDARIAQIGTELETAPLRERMRFKRELRELDRTQERRASSVAALDRADAKAREAAQAELERLTAYVEGHQLPEREEWVAIAGHAADGTPRLSGLAAADPDAAYDDLVRAIRRDAFESDDSAGVILQANDGALWTGRMQSSPDELLRMHAQSSRRAYGDERPTMALRALSVGGRTLQWDNNGTATLA